jgi:hypothetical protein
MSAALTGGALSNLINCSQDGHFWSGLGSATVAHAQLDAQEVSPHPLVFSLHGGLVPMSQ